MKALKPITPRSASSSSRAPGTSAPHSPKSTEESRRAASSLASKAAPSAVGGVEFSGMSKYALKPPAASAALPVRMPFPVRAAGLVEVHVRVQAAGEDVQAARVDLARAVRSSGATSAITPSPTPTSAAHDAAGRHHVPAADD